MRYLDKEPFSSAPNSKEYRKNWDRVFGKKVDMEIDIDDDVEKFINEYAAENNLSFNDAVIEILEKQLGLMEEKKEPL